MQSIMVPALNSSLNSTLGPTLTWKGRMAGSILILAFACLSSAPALAHAMLVKAEPARRAQLTQTPAQVRLWFNEEVEKDYASLAVLDPAKASVTDTLPQIAADDPKAIVLALPELAPGKYTVKFRVLSVDGHVVDSSYDFTVKSKAPAK
jgi:methionine-rich copper-binding protein CopC